MPVDYTYLLGHVLFARAHNCHCMIGNGRQQALYCAYTAVVCFTAPWILHCKSVQMLRAGVCALESSSYLFVKGPVPKSLDKRGSTVIV